jgi:hypothetical protein
MGEPPSILIVRDKKQNFSPIGTFAGASSISSMANPQNV